MGTPDHRDGGWRPIPQGRRSPRARNRLDDQGRVGRRDPTRLHGVHRVPTPRGAGERLVIRATFRWASATGAHGMATPEELVYLGYVPALRDGAEARDPRYPGSILMR